LAHGCVCPIRSGLPLRAEVCAGRCVTLNTLERNIMRKTSLALAVAASTLGLSQVASADLIGDTKVSLEARNFYFNRDFREGAGQSKADEWAQGFILRMNSGFTEGTVGLGLDAIGMFGFKLN